MIGGYYTKEKALENCKHSCSYIEKIGRKEIEILLDGGSVAMDNGEYTAYLILEEEEEDDDEDE